MPGSILKEMYVEYQNEINRIKSCEEKDLYKIGNSLWDQRERAKKENIKKEQDEISKELNRSIPDLVFWFESIIESSQFITVMGLRISQCFSLFTYRKKINLYENILYKYGWYKRDGGSMFVKEYNIYDFNPDPKTNLEFEKMREKIDNKYDLSKKRLDLWYEHEKSKIIDQFRIEEFKLGE